MAKFAQLSNMHTCGPWARLAGNCLQKYVCAPHFVCFYRTHWGWLVCTKTPWQAEGTLKPGNISQYTFIPWKMLQRDGSLSVSLVSPPTVTLWHQLTIATLTLTSLKLGVCGLSYYTPFLVCCPVLAYYLQVLGTRLTAH